MKNETNLSFIETYHVIGINNNYYVSSFKEVEEQIEYLKTKQINIQDDVKDWLAFDNVEQNLSILQVIKNDRRQRNLEGLEGMMANRPPFAIFKEFGGVITGVAYYEGHDELSCSFNFGIGEIERFGIDIS
jgi:hypothetical protein